MMSVLTIEKIARPKPEHDREEDGEGGLREELLGQGEGWDMRRHGCWFNSRYSSCPMLNAIWIRKGYVAISMKRGVICMLLVLE